MLTIFGVTIRLFYTLWVTHASCIKIFRVSAPQMTNKIESGCEPYRVQKLDILEHARIHVFQGIKV